MAIRGETEPAEGRKLFLTVVVPVYNEEDNVAILYEEIRKSVGPLGRRCEVIFVDDGSTDGTLQRLRGLLRRGERRSTPQVSMRIIRLARNFGQTAATQAGFDRARGDVIVTLDGDLQNDPKDIPRLLSRLEEGYDVVCGWRRDRKDKRLTRILPSRAANWLIGVMTGVRIHDNGCSLRAYRASVIKSIRLYSDMHRFISPMCTMVGATITEMVVNHRPRRHGATKYGLSRTWKVLLDMITVKMLIDFYGRPLTFFSIPGLLAFVAASGFGAAAMVGAMRGYHSIVLTGGSFLLFFLFGSLMSWGLLAEYFVRTTVRGRFVRGEPTGAVTGACSDGAAGDGSMKA